MTIIGGGFTIYMSIAILQERDARSGYLKHQHQTRN